MIGRDFDRELTVVGAEVAGKFHIPEEGTHKVMWMIREAVYDDPELACAREPSHNAVDSHKVAGVEDLPHTVHAPTYEEPYYVCRDYGTGISREGFLKYFLGFGATTKDTTNSQIGYFGIGCKAPFALVDQFTVTSWHGGEKVSYSCALDASQKGKAYLLSANDCGDETGLEVKVGIPPERIRKFQDSLRYTLRYLTPRPNINIDLGPPIEELAPGLFLDKKGPWVCLMGGFPYELPLRKMDEDLREHGLQDICSHSCGGFSVEIGELEPSLNRESILLTDRARELIIEKLCLIKDASLETMLAILTDESRSGEERRRSAIWVKDVLKFPLPENYGELSEGRIPLPKHKAFRLLDRARKNVEAIPLSSADSFRFLIRSEKDRRALSGWSILRRDFLVVPQEGYTRDQVREALKDYLKDLFLEDLPILPVEEEFSWSRERAEAHTPVDTSKYKEQIFLLTGDNVKTSRQSSNWSKTEPPQEHHYYVVLKKFKGAPVLPDTPFLQTYLCDQDLCRRFGLEMPPKLYGYRDSAANPVQTKDIQGTSYLTWRNSVLIPAIRNKLMDIWKALSWVAAGPSMFFYAFRKLFLNENSLRLQVQVSRKELGLLHPITRFFEESLKAHETLKNSSISTKILENIYLTVFLPCPDFRSLKTLTYQWALKRYPMFGLVSYRSLHELFGEVRLERLIQYVKHMDALRGGTCNLKLEEIRNASTD